ncbi:ORF148 [Betabaculovirus altermyunipunctae]|uniref:ORF148 n=1 Tax=Betabaculovirus altermyunipunctae TaxID=3051996 RepID=A0A1S5YEA2_9BBAC|nr:ORF148 [Betabaculovirus altermyunipunctae]AQQ80414.1 ORF148 [Betabaculovirus altermyunipunctae]
MENLTRLSSHSGFFARFNWKMFVMVMVVLFAMLAVAYNFNEDFLVQRNVLQGKVQRVTE